MKNITLSNPKKDVLVLNDEEHLHYISSLYEKAKILYKNEDNNADKSIEELFEIQAEFLHYSDKKGVLFCHKALSIIYEKRGDAITDVNDRIAHYENAHDNINEAVVQAIQMKWEQPSLFKRQAIIKSKLGSMLHQAGDHYNANILESSGFKIFGKLLNENPDYAEAHLEIATASLNKIKWSLRKIVCELDKAENLFNKPKHTKHLPDVNELLICEQRINEMRSTISLLLAITNG